MPLLRVEPDGTRVYTNYLRYKPVAPEDRKYKVNKPKDPRAVRFRGDWFLPLVLLDDAERVMPATRPDMETFEHSLTCFCEVCQRPAAKALWRNKRLRNAWITS